MTFVSHPDMLHEAHRRAGQQDDEAFRTVVGLLLLALATPVGTVLLLPMAYALITGDLAALAR